MTSDQAPAYRFPVKPRPGVPGSPPRSFRDVAAGKRSPPREEPPAQDTIAAVVARRLSALSFGDGTESSRRFSQGSTDTPKPHSPRSSFAPAATQTEDSAKSFTLSHMHRDTSMSSSGYDMDISDGFSPPPPHLHQARPSRQQPSEEQPGAPLSSSTVSRTGSISNRRASFQPVSPTQSQKTLTSRPQNVHAHTWSSSWGRKRADSISGIPINGRRSSIYIEDSHLQDEEDDTEDGAFQYPTETNLQTQSAEVLIGRKPAKNGTRIAPPPTPPLHLGLRPIPSLIGPNDLPYAHNPSFTDAYVFLDTNLQFDSLFWPEPRTCLVESASNEDATASASIPPVKTTGARRLGAAASARSDTNHRGKGNSGSSRGNRATSKGRSARNALPPSNAPYWEQLQMMALQDSNVGLDIGSSDCQPPLPYDYQVAPQDQELVKPYPSLLQPFYATPTTEHLEAPPSTFSDACSFQPKPFVTSGDVADLTQLMRSQSFSSCAIPAARSDCDRGVARSRMSTDQMFSTGQVAAPPTWTPPRGMTAPTFGGNAIAAFQPPMMTDFNFDGVQTWGSDGSPSMMLSPEQGRWVNNLLSDASIYDPIGDSFSPDTQSQQRGPVSKTIVGDSLPCDLETLAWQPQQSRYHLISNPTHQNKPLSQKSQNLSFKKTPSPQDSRPKNQGGRKLFDRATRSLDSGRNEERTSQASRDVFTAESSARHPARDGNNLQDAKNNKRGGRGARGRNYSKPKAAVTSEGLDKENKA